MIFVRPRGSRVAEQSSHSKPPNSKLSAPALRCLLCPHPIAAALLMELTLGFGLLCLPEYRASCQGCRGQ